MFFLLWGLLHHVYAEPLYLHISGMTDQPVVAVQIQGETQAIPMLPHKEKQWLGVVDAPSSHFWNIHVESVAHNKTLFHSILRSTQHHIYLGYDQKNQSLQQYTQEGTRTELISSDQQWLLWRGLWFACAFICLELCVRVFPVLQQPRHTPKKQRWQTPLLFLLLFFVWNGLAIWKSGIFGLQYDALGTYWFANQSPSWEGFFDAQGNWPNGISYKRLDSFLFYTTAVLFQWIPTDIFMPAFALCALTMSAWAASKLAEELGATTHASWIAGLTYMGNGLAANALLEGHIYHLLQPWLPLCLLFAWRSTKTQPTYTNSILTAVFWMLCLLTSAYLGLATTIMLITLWLLRKGWNNTKSYAGIALMIMGGIAYMMLYTSGSELSSGRSPLSMMVGSISLSTFLGYTPQVDFFFHTRSLGILALPLSLALLCVSVAPKRWDAHILWWIGGIALVLGLGCFLTAGSVSPILPLPLLWLSKFSFFQAIGFPIRLAWPFLLCIGVLASLALSHMRHQRLIILLVVCELFFSTQLASRQQHTTIEIPTAYKQDTSPSLEIYPHIPSGYQHSDIPMWFSAYSCFAQTKHHKPIGENCISTASNAHSRIAISHSVTQDLLKGNSAQAWNTLHEHKYASVLFFWDLYTQGDARRIQHALSIEPTKTQEGYLYASHYIPPQVQLEHPSQSINQWGTTVLDTTKQITFRISSPTPLSHIQVQGLDCPLYKEAITELYIAQCTQELSFQTQVDIFTDEKQSIWKGSFFPASEQESLFIDVQTGWKLAAPYTPTNPINKEVGDISKQIWLMLILCGVGISFARYRYPLRNLFPDKNKHNNEGRIL